MDREKARGRAVARAEQQRREALRAERLAAEDGTSPTVLGRVFVRQASGLVEVVLVDRQLTPMRVTLARGENIDPVNLVGTMRTLGATLIENSGYHEPEGRFWTKGVIDPFGGGGAKIPEGLAPIGAPLYSLPAIDVELDPTDEELEAAREVAREQVEALATTKARARDLASTLRAALAAGPHAVDAIIAALEEHGRTASTQQTPPEAA